MNYINDLGQVSMMAPDGTMTLVPVEEVTDYLALDFAVVCGFSA